MKPIDAAGFEQKFRADPDPWNYRASPFEAWKRGLLLRACGTGPFGRALELGCANGETTAALAPRCLRLLAVDSSPTALEAAEARLRGTSNVTLRRALLPVETPRGPFDLVVMSEVAYYLPPRALRQLLERLDLALAPGGRVVVLHHVRDFDDAAQKPALAQRKVRAHLSRRMKLVVLDRRSRFEVAAYRKPLR